MDLSLIFIVLAAVCAFLGTSIAAYWIMAPKQGVLQTRLRAYVDYYDPTTDPDLGKPLMDRAVLPTLQWIVAFLSRATPAKVADETRTRLVMAGKPLTASTFLGLKFGAVLLFPGLYLLLMLGNPEGPGLLNWALLALVAFISYRLPDIWLNSRISARQEAIRRALPDALDLITVSIEAGLAMDAAIARVAEKTRGPLSDEFRQALSEMGFGRMRRDALRDVGRRTGVSDLISFLAAVIQADTSGVSIGQVLRVQSEQMRVRRRQRAQEAAQKLPVKILFPLMFCILPATFIVILGPAMISLSNSFMGIGG
jgi:tight adherence protein C